MTVNEARREVTVGNEPITRFYLGGRAVRELTPVQIPDIPPGVEAVRRAVAQQEHGERDILARMGITSDTVDAEAAR